METRRQTNFKNNSTPEISRISKFLCQISGSDLSILAQCPHEISRHARIGAIIISTSGLAFISMFFAIQTISRSSITAFIAGFIWSTVIFVLDSYIVASYKKCDNKWEEFKIVLPRLFLALVLGCSISIPLELKVFENEISEKIKIIETEEEIIQQQKINDSYNREIQPFFLEKTGLKTENDNIKKDLQPITDKINRLEQELADEIGGIGRTGILNYGPVARQLDQQLQQAKKDKIQKENEIAPKITANNSRILQLDSIIASIPRKSISKVNLYGISSRLEGLKRLTSTNNYVLIAYWVFFLLILGIETAPIFVKFFTPKGSYDEILAMNEYIVFLEQQKRKSDLHEIINSEIETIRSMNEKKKATQDLVNERVMTEIANAQEKIAKKAIHLWKEGQLKQVEQNLTSFIN